MQKSLIILCLLIFSCSKLPQTIGKLNDVIVITSERDQQIVKLYLNSLFSKVIYTPQNENEFNLKYVLLNEFNKYKKFTNIIICSLEFPVDSTVDIFVKNFFDDYKENSNIMALYDLFAKDQLVSLIKSLDAIEFEKIVKGNNDWILNNYRNLFEKKIKLNLYKSGHNTSLSNKINKMFNLDVKLQLDYKIISFDSLNSFIWIGRGYPYRWLIFHKSKKNNYYDPISAWTNLNIEYSKYLNNINISSHFREYDKVFDTIHIATMRGIYEHTNSESGGPFFVNIFDKKDSNEVILVSGFVNNPGYEKLYLLKQLEVIVKTIKMENLSEI